MLAEFLLVAVPYLLGELSGLPLAECNAYCREFAMQLLDELGPLRRDREAEADLPIAQVARRQAGRG